MEEKRTMILLTVIALATLVAAIVGTTFAFFSATSIDDRRPGEGQGETEFHTATVANTTKIANIEGAAGKFTVRDIYPGHQEVAGLSVEITRGSEDHGDTFSIPFLYAVSQNTIGKNVKYYLYSSTEDIKVDLGCTIAIDKQDAKTHYSESCPNITHGKQKGDTVKINGKDLTLVDFGNLKGGEENIQMVDELKISEGTTAKKYYYFVLEFVDTKEDQPDDMNKIVIGNISVM